MFERIDKKSILLSSVLGIIIGLFAQIVLNSLLDIRSLLICMFISAVIGLVIGTAIAFIQAALPIQSAQPRSYFIFSNVIALLITFAVILLLYLFGMENFTIKDLGIVLLIAFIIITGANVFEYYRYKRTNRKLIEYIDKKSKSH